MGFIEFIVICIVVIALAWCGTWALDYFFAGHPAIVNKLIWGIAVVIILVILAQAIGLMSHDPKIPSLK